MRKPKVRLYIRVRLPDGRDAFLDPVWNKNRTLRASYALVEGQPEHHSESTYYLRFLRGGKPCLAAGRPGSGCSDHRPAQYGTRPSVDCLGTPNSDASYKPESANCFGPHHVQTRPSFVDLSEKCHQVLLRGDRGFRSPKPIAACEHMLNLFESRFPGKAIKDVAREDLLEHMSFSPGKGPG